MNLVDSYILSLQAINAALHMLENGASIEDVKSVCAPSDLFQLARWKVHEYIENTLPCCNNGLLLNIMNSCVSFLYVIGLIVYFSLCTMRMVNITPDNRKIPMILTCL